MAPARNQSEIVEQILCSLTKEYPAPDQCRSIPVFDRDGGNFLLIHEGWQKYRRVYGVWAHVELRDCRFLIHEDGTQEGIATLLMDAGISRDQIVLAFYGSDHRTAGGFAA